MNWIESHKMRNKIKYKTKTGIIGTRSVKPNLKAIIQQWLILLYLTRLCLVLLETIKTTKGDAVVLSSDKGARCKNIKILNCRCTKKERKKEPDASNTRQSQAGCLCADVQVESTRQSLFQYKLQHWQFIWHSSVGRWLADHLLFSPLRTDDDNVNVLTEQLVGNGEEHCTTTSWKTTWRTYDQVLEDMTAMSMKTMKSQCYKNKQSCGEVPWMSCQTWSSV